MEKRVVQKQDNDRLARAILDNIWPEMRRQIQNGETDPVALIANALENEQLSVAGKVLPWRSR